MGSKLFSLLITVVVLCTARALHAGIDDANKDCTAKPGIRGDVERRDQSPRRIITAEAFAIKSLPLDEGARTHLDATSQKLRSGVVLLGTGLPTPDSAQPDFQGTGFVISTARRLVVTAAHVADEFSRGQPMFAVTDGATVPCRVCRAWYHPDTIRALDYFLFVRSCDPRDGEITSRGPDLAVLELAKDGPPLSSQVQLASAKELGSLDGRGIGALAFPNDIENRWPTPSRPVNATFTASVLAAMTDVNLSSKQIPLAERKSLWFHSDLGPGASGSPIFLPNVHIVGVIRGGVRYNDTHLCRAFRIDTLGELLAYHHLDTDELAGVPILSHRADWGPKPPIGRFYRSVELVREAYHLRKSGLYGRAYEKCTEALSLAPNYGRALLERSAASLDDLWNRSKEMNDRERIRSADRGYEDARRCVELYNEWNLACLLYAESLIYRSFHLADRDGYKSVLAETELLRLRKFTYTSLSPADMGALFNIRARAHLYLGEMEEARHSFDESIRPDPSNPERYLDRARYWEGLGRPDLAKADREEAKRRREARNRDETRGRTTGT